MLETVYPLLLPTIKMMNAFSVVITDMERHGCNVDLNTLDEIEKDIRNKFNFVSNEIQRLVEEAVGDVKINLDSPEQLSQLIYSIKVKDKKQWADTFGLGTEVRNSVRKKKRTKYYTDKQLRKIIKEQTEPFIKQRVDQCDVCKGEGKVSWKKKDGTPAKKKKLCPNPGCASGVLYTSLGEKAGFGCGPIRSSHATTGGFGTSAEILQELVNNGQHEKTKDFLTYLVQHGKYTHNLRTSIDGIRRNIGRGSILHSRFNQTVTATGRLSSTAPNVHNWERGTTFPIRRVVSSRWPGGKITKGDFSGLEFRIAVELSKDKQGFKDLEAGIDAHERTRAILEANGQNGSRQAAKAFTFKPLYGGTSGTAPQQAYYQFFFEQYPGIRNWHENLQNAVLTKGRIIIPSGRIYKFTGVQRYPSGAVSRSTQIKNYPVQGFATADIVPIATIEMWRQLQENNLNSIIINEVHDDITVDTHPDELDIVPQIMYTSMTMTKELLKHWYNYELQVELPVEIMQGPNWLDVERIM